MFADKNLPQHNAEQTVTNRTQDGGHNISLLNTDANFLYSGQFNTILLLLTVYVPAIAIIFGTLTNIFTAVILARILSGLQLPSTVLYLLVAVIMDSIVIVLFGWDDWLKRFANINATQMSMDASDIVCRLYPFISDTALHLGTWLMVAMMTDTVLMRVYPGRAMELLHRERAKSVILILTVLAICVNAQCFWTYALIRIDKTTERAPKV